jgi:hypothetical protein
LEDPRITNDMDLLGCALNKFIATELPSSPQPKKELLSNHYIFDGAAIGQYLLGIDPIHTNGSVISGFQNANFSFDLSTFGWSIPRMGKLVLTFESVEYQILNLHAHSKEILGIPNPTDPRWTQILQEANHEKSREIILREIKNFHLMKPSLRDRIRIGRKAGLMNYSINYVVRKLNLVWKCAK